MATRIECDWNYIVIKKDAEATQSAGGIIYGDIGRPPVCSGKVVESGPGHYDSRGNFIKNTIKKGDRVIMSPWAGFEEEFQVKDKDGKFKVETYTMMSDSDVFISIPKGDPRCDTANIVFSQKQRAM